MPIPTFDWFDQAPDNYRTINQLGSLGLKPGGPIVAQVVWDRGRKYARLYDLNQAIPKRQLSPEYRAKLEAEKEKRRTCPVCRRRFEYILYGSVCQECHDYHPDGTPKCEDGTIHGYGTDWMQVWLPLDSPPEPINAATPNNWRYFYWIPYPKEIMHLWIDQGDMGPFLPGHTHAWVPARLFNTVLQEWSPEEFARHAEEYPIIREWAIDAGMPGSAYLEWAMSGLPREDAAELRVLWYEKRVSYYQDMKKYQL